MGAAWAEKRSWHRSETQLGGVPSELSLGVHLEVGGGGGKDPSRETKKKWPERWEGTKEPRGRGGLGNRVWPAAENAAEKSGRAWCFGEAEGRSQVSAPGADRGKPGRSAGRGVALAGLAHLAGRQTAGKALLSALSDRPLLPWGTENT